MSLRVVLYAEGPGEDRGEDAWLPVPGEPMQPEMLGPAHHLVARVIAQDHAIPLPAVVFVSPFRIKARPHRGSDLLHKKNLRRLLTIASPARRPQLAVVLVDEDGHPERRREIQECTVGLDLPRVVAVPVREFEAWLIADQQALSRVLAVSNTPPSPEAMAPGRAKELLQTWIAQAFDPDTKQAERGLRIQQLRTELVQHSDLLVLDGLSAFRQFRADLRSTMPSVH